MFRIIGYDWNGNHRTIVDATDCTIEAHATLSTKKILHDETLCLSANVALTISCNQSQDNAAKLLRGTLLIYQVENYKENAYYKQHPDEQHRLDQEFILSLNEQIEQELMKKLNRTNILNIAPEFGFSVADVDRLACDDNFVSLNNLRAKNTPFVVCGYVEPQVFIDEGNGNASASSPLEQIVSAVSVTFSANYMTDEELAVDKPDYDKCYIKACCILSTGENVTLYGDIVCWDDVRDYCDACHISYKDDEEVMKHVNSYLRDIVRLLNRHLLEGYVCSISKTVDFFRSELLHKYES